MGDGPFAMPVSSIRTRNEIGTALLNDDERARSRAYFSRASTSSALLLSLLNRLIGSHSYSVTSAPMLGLLRK
jgi:hypothetical protein